MNVVADSYYNHRYLWDIVPICSNVEVKPGYLY